MLTNQKSERGITLVALVVTIVVLLILAGVTIAFVLSDDGIIGKAKEAATTTEKQAVEENVKLALMSAKIPESIGKANTSALILKEIQDSLPTGMTATDGDVSAASPLTYTPASGETKATLAGKITITYKSNKYVITISSFNDVSAADPVAAE